MPQQPSLHRPNAPRKAQKHQRNRQQKRAMHTGSKAWRIIRGAVLLRDGYTCRVKGCKAFGDQVDHIDGDDSNNPEDGSNWQTLCHSHHSEKTRREMNARGRSDADR